MRILILGTGQGGTCLLTEAVRGLGIVSFTRRVEDRDFFKHGVLPRNYGTKLTTDCIMRITVENFPCFLVNLKESMRKHADLHIVFSLRHPLDIFMAQIVRGKRPSEGGDGNIKKDVVSDTGTIDGSLLAIRHFYYVYKNIMSCFSKRTLAVKMENLVLKPRKEINRIAEFFTVEPTQQAYEFYKYNRNKYQKGRYGTNLNKSVVALYKRWDTWHNGFFRNRRGDIDFAISCLAGIIQDLGYK